ncbi:MAG: hypothetical protein JWM68_3543 [Verrucomicrobiales bacterium]|nr:hypothetical protein [Verrucomicrobiales bacterium]
MQEKLFPPSGRRPEPRKKFFSISDGVPSQEKTFSRFPAAAKMTKIDIFLHAGGKKADQGRHIELRPRGNVRQFGTPRMDPFDGFLPFGLEKSFNRGCLSRNEMSRRNFGVSANMRFE